MDQAACWIPNSLRTAVLFPHFFPFLADYDWQGEQDERFWCLACAKCKELTVSNTPRDNDLCVTSGGHCQRGDQLWIRDCLDGKGAEFQVKSYTDGDMLHVTNVDNADEQLCITWVEGTPFVSLEDCDPTLSAQKYKPIDKQGGPFEISPVFSAASYCLSQDHHPKTYEVVGLQPCEESIRDNTAYWQLYELAW